MFGSDWPDCTLGLLDLPAAIRTTVGQGRFQCLIDSGGHRAAGPFFVRPASLPPRLSRMALWGSFGERRRLPFRRSPRPFQQRLQLTALDPQVGHLGAERPVLSTQKPQLRQHAPPPRRSTALRSWRSHAPDYGTDSAKRISASPVRFAGAPEPVHRACSAGCAEKPVLPSPEYTAFQSGLRSLRKSIKRAVENDNPRIIAFSSRALGRVKPILS